MGRSGASSYFRAERIVGHQDGHPHLRFAPAAGPRPAANQVPPGPGPAPLALPQTPVVLAEAAPAGPERHCRERRGPSAGDGRGNRGAIHAGLLCRDREHGGTQAVSRRSGSPREARSEGPKVLLLFLERTQASFRLPRPSPRRTIAGLGRERERAARGLEPYRAGTRRRILSSSGAGEPRPSRLLVARYSSPSGPTTTSRSRP